MTVVITSECASPFDASEPRHLHRVCLAIRCECRGSPDVDANKKSRPLFGNSSLLLKTAATYSPTVTQYHRRDWA